jgi:hypothetical protein
MGGLETAWPKDSEHDFRAKLKQNCGKNQRILLASIAEPGSGSSLSATKERMGQQRGIAALSCLLSCVPPLLMLPD